MSYFAATIQREIKRMDALCFVYENQLAELPKGSLQVKKRKEKLYYYLTYRHNGKVVSKYAGNNERNIADLKEQLERRKGIERLLRGLKKEIAMMKKVISTTK